MFGAEGDGARMADGGAKNAHESGQINLASKYGARSHAGIQELQRVEQVDEEER